MPEVFSLENYLPTYKTQLDELTEDEREIYNTLFGGSFESDRQAAIERAAFYERMNSAPAEPKQAAATAAQDEDGRGFLNNQARGLGAAFFRVGGEIIEGMAAIDALTPRGVVPGVPHYAAPMVNEQRAFERSMTDEEFKAHKARGYQLVTGIADSVKSVDFGYDSERNSVEKTKELFSKGNWLAGSMSVPGMLTDQLSQSIPYMLSAPVTAFAVGGNTARERVNNTEGKLAPDGADVAIGAVVGSASGVLERLLPKMIFRPGEAVTQAEARTIADSATKYAMGKIGKEAAKGATVEALTEAIQTGVLEYVGQRYGTDKAMSLHEAAMQGLEGALIGGGIGGSLGAARGAVDAQRNRVNARSVSVDEDGIDLPQNGEQLRNVGDVEVGDSLDLSQNGSTVSDTNSLHVQPQAYAAPLISTGDHSNPDDRFKFELNPDSLRARVQNIRAKRRAEMNRVNRTVDFAPVEIPAAPAANSALQNIDSIEFTPPAIPEPSRFSLAPLEPSRYDNGVDFASQSAEPAPAGRVNELAAGIEKAIDKNIDRARNARMPENLKDVRLLRARYREHLSDVVAGVESNAGAFEKADSLLEMAAKNGGLNADAWVSEGVDPADVKAKNGSTFTKAFRSEGGMTPDDLAEFAAQNGFSGFTDDSGAPVSGAAIEAVLGEMAGNKRYSSADDLKLQSAQAAPDYVKELAEFGTPAEIKKAVTKALNGEKLGPRQAVIVQEVLDSTNRFKRDDAAVIEKWEKRARTMLANKGNRELDQWRNRDEHEVDATTEDAALNELMTDAMVHYGIDPDKVIAAHEKYAKRYPDSLGKLTYAMTAWVSANKPATREPEQNGARDSVPGHRSDRRDDEGVQVPVQRPAGELGAVDAGLSIPRQRQAAEAGSAQGGIESGTPTELGSDSARGNPGLRQPVDFALESQTEESAKAESDHLAAIAKADEESKATVEQKAQSEQSVERGIEDLDLAISDIALQKEKQGEIMADLQAKLRPFAGRLTPETEKLQADYYDALRNFHALRKEGEDLYSKRAKLIPPVQESEEDIRKREAEYRRAVREAQVTSAAHERFKKRMDKASEGFVSGKSGNRNIGQSEPMQETKEPRPSAGVSVAGGQENANKPDNQQNSVENADYSPSAERLDSAEQENAALVKAIPPSILKSLKVDYDVYDENTESYSAEQVSARDALKSVNEDIETYNSLLKCVRGG